MADGAPDPGRGGDDAGFEAAVQGLEQAFSRLVLQHRQVMVRYAAALSPALSVGAMKAFMMLANEGTMTPSAVAEGLLVDRAQVSRMVRDLEAAGLITGSALMVDGGWTAT